MLRVLTQPGSKAKVNGTQNDVRLLPNSGQPHSPFFLFIALVN